MAFALAKNDEAQRMAGQLNQDANALAEDASNATNDVLDTRRSRTCGSALKGLRRESLERVFCAILHDEISWRGSSLPTAKPFDVFAKGSETGDWLLRLDSSQQPSG